MTTIPEKEEEEKDCMKRQHKIHHTKSVQEKNPTVTNFDTSRAEREFM